MKTSTKWFRVIAILTGLLAAGSLDAGTYIVGADNLVAVGTTPIDSEATISELFEVLQKDWGITRLWWRGGEQKFFDEHCDFVTDDRIMTIHSHIWQWFLEQKDNASNAVTLGKDLGLEMWWWKGLFELGASRDTGGNGRLPFTFEDRLRIAHPEWLPVNRYGTRRQSGPVEFCYPQARATYIRNMKAFLLQEGYQGIVLHTYTENFGTRYLDEFGFNQPIVDEFKKRYGVDIRTEPFDKEAWAALRGEYVTQFLRELRAALRPHNIKVAIMISCKKVGGEDSRPDLPMAWPGVWSKLGSQRIGRILMDWQTWVDEGLVDELNIFYPGSESIAVAMRDYCRRQNPEVEVSMYPMGSTIDPFPEGVRRIAHVPGGTPAALQSGFPAGQVSDPPDDRYADPVQTLKNGDKWQKRQILYLASRGRLALDLKDIAAAAEDEDVFVRSTAIRALRASGLADAIPYIEAKLSDSENSVRILAALELGHLPGANSVQKIMDAVVSRGTIQYNFFAIPRSLQTMKNNGTFGDAQKLLLRQYCGHADPRVRQVAIYTIASLGIADAFKEELLYLAANETNHFCRTKAMYYIASNFDIEETFEILKTNLESSDPAIQIRAAEALGYYDRTRLSESYQEKILDLLLGLFQQYHSENDRLDRQWGWRIVGNGLLGLGDNGESALKKLMQETTDSALAELAWRVVYIRQYRNQYAMITEEQDNTAHSFHPFLSWEFVNE